MAPQICPCYVAALVVLGLLFSGHATAKEVRLASAHATFNVPDDWVPIEAAAIEQANAQMRLAGVAGVGSYVAGFCRRKGELPYFLVQQTDQDMRHVSWSAIEHEMEHEFEEGVNEGLKIAAKSSGDAVAEAKIENKSIDRDRARVTIHMTTPTRDWVTYQYLTKQGLLLIHAYQSPKAMSATRSSFDSIADSVAIDPEFRFVDSSADSTPLLSREAVAGGISGAVAVIVFAAIQRRRRAKENKMSAA